MIMNRFNLNFHSCISFLVLLFLFISCDLNNENKDRNEIVNIMKKQESDWSRGDLGAYMQGYWKSDSLRFVTKRGITCGWQNMLDRYKKSYPDKNSMGKLKFEIMSIEFLCENTALVTGKWTLMRPADELSGFYTLVWKKIGGKWVIVIDHTS